MDYKDTLNLPKTDFPMKANLPNMEPEMLKFWDEMDLYSAILEERKDSNDFILHDGPPYANGHIHIGTTFNKILKDYIVKYKNLRGFRSPYVPGWDCHGMPIEHNVTKDLGSKLRDISKLELRKKCREYAGKYVNVQKEEFKRLGVFGEWDNPYITMSNLYESEIIGNFGKLVEKGYIYRGLRPIHWCMKCQTALAGNEVEYEDRKSPSIFVKFKLKGAENKHLLIWTTTPWTLPANIAAAMNRNEEYVEAETDFGTLIFAKKLAESIKEKIGGGKFNISSVNPASKYADAEYERPILKGETGRVIYADFVDMETGTGIVHIAPGHGYDDYQAGVKNGLEILSPVDEAGRFTDAAGKYSGQKVFEANRNIIEDLKGEGALIFEEEMSHSYPVCWRCKTDLIFRATEQWFLNVEHEDLRNRLLKEIDGVNWIPYWSKDRIYNMVQVRPDWCLSRQRSWGVPLPVLYCSDCREPLLDKGVIDKVRDKVLESGSDIWFEKSVEELVGELKCPKCGGTHFEKETNIFDVWFDSATSYSAVLKTYKDLRFPSDLYLEAVDQHRGWFQVSLIVSTAADGKAPYGEVLTHGLILDKNMKKMSKSLGNVVSPEQICKKYGAEILRLWFASIDYTSDAAFDEEIMKTSLDVYFKLRNTYKFMLGNLAGFDYDSMKVEKEKMLSIDRYILSRLSNLREKVYAAYDVYEFHRVFREYYNFFVNELSAFYLDILKDRLYTAGRNSVERRSGQTAIYILIDNLVKYIAPIIPFTAEQIYKYFNKSGKKGSIHLEVMNEDIDILRDRELENAYETLIQVRGTVLTALEKLRSDNVIGKSLEASVSIYSGSDETRAVLEKYSDMLTQIFIVSDVEILSMKSDDFTVSDEKTNLYVTAKKANGEKCGRCWVYSESVGKNSEHPELCGKCVDAIKSEV